MLRRLHRLSGRVLCAALLAGCAAMPSAQVPVSLAREAECRPNPLDKRDLYLRGSFNTTRHASAHWRELRESAGHFRLTSPTANGILPGPYRVTVSKKQYSPGMKVPSAKEMSFALSAKMRETLPKRYTLPDQTPLRIDVPRGGKKDVELALTSGGG